MQHAISEYNIPLVPHATHRINLRDLYQQSSYNLRWDQTLVFYIFTFGHFVINLVNVTKITRLNLDKKGFQLKLKYQNWNTQQENEELPIHFFKWYCLPIFKIIYEKITYTNNFLSKQITYKQTAYTFVIFVDQGIIYTNNSLNNLHR